MAPTFVSVKPGFGGLEGSYEEARVVFLGIPLDSTSSYRSGSRFAPSRIREASLNLETHLMSLGVELAERGGIADLGDLLLSSDLAEDGRRVEEAVRGILEDGKLPALLGGEHTLTLFSLAAFGDVYLLQLDAHRDLREEYLGSRINHATVMRRVLDRVGPERLIQLGVRSCSSEEAEFGKGIRFYTTEQLLEEGESVLREVRREVGSSPVYLTLDLDVLDPAFAPAVSTPEPGGLSTLDLLRILRGLRGLNLKGFDVVEVVPPFDTGITAFAAARAIYELLGILL
ncbi:MAG: agmatinase [Hadesarchaea archaeon]|jgi:agmatinase|nr:agmatinase [Hadesarchaea archaeon]